MIDKTVLDTNINCRQACKSHFLRPEISSLILVKPYVIKDMRELFITMHNSVGYIILLFKAFSAGKKKVHVKHLH